MAETRNQRETGEERRALLTSEVDALHVRRVVASNPNTPKHVLDRLSGDPNCTIRRHVAENPRTPIELLKKLADDESYEVRLAVAENVYTPPDVLALLSNDESVDVRYGVAENPRMPENILLDLAKDDNPYIRCRALKTLQMLAPDVQSRLKLIMEQHLRDSL